MKISLQCPSCRKGYVVDSTRIPPEGGIVRCVACDAEIPVKGVAAPRPAPRTAEPRPHPPAPPPAAPVDVVCPRCGLHFAPTAGAPVESRSRRVILVIEDMEYFRESARDALSGRYDVRCVGTVGEALEVMGTIQVDLIVIDLNLENGEESFTLLRTMPGPSVPILAFTAQDESEMYGDGWRRLQEAGVRDVIPKGMNLGENLARKVASLLGETPAEGPRGA